MKLLLIIFTLISTLYLRAQDANPIARNYELSSTTLLQQCIENGNTSGLGTKSLPGGAKFTIVRRLTISKQINAETKEDKTFYVIRFWAWDGVDAVEKNGDFRLDASTNQAIYFLLTPEELEFYAVEYVRRYSPVAGTLAYPFKFRPQGQLVFSKDIALTGVGGIRRNFGAQGNSSLSFTIGIGLSSVTLDSLNTGGIINGTSERAAATIPFSFIYQWDKLQIGLTTGIDLLSTDSRDSWIYHGKPWFAIGIGFSIFSSDATKVTDDENNTNR